MSKVRKDHKIKTAFDQGFTESRKRQARTVQVILEWVYIFRWVNFSRMTGNFRYAMAIEMIQIFFLVWLKS